MQSNIWNNESEFILHGTDNVSSLEETPWRDTPVSSGNNGPYDTSLLWSHSFLDTPLLAGISDRTTSEAFQDFPSPSYDSTNSDKSSPSLNGDDIPNDSDYDSYSQGSDPLGSPRTGVILAPELEANQWTGHISYNAHDYGMTMSSGIVDDVPSGTSPRPLPPIMAGHDSTHNNDTAIINPIQQSSGQPSRNKRRPAPIDSRTESSRTSTIRSKKVRSYLCPIPGCGQEFTRRGDVKRHTENSAKHRRRSISPDDPTRCTKCGEALSRPDARKRHEERGACGKRTIRSTPPEVSVFSS